MLEPLLAATMRGRSALADAVERQAWQSEFVFPAAQRVDQKAPCVVLSTAFFVAADADHRGEARCPQGGDGGIDELRRRLARHPHLLPHDTPRCAGCSGRTEAHPLGDPEKFRSC